MADSLLGRPAAAMGILTTWQWGSSPGVGLQHRAGAAGLGIYLSLLSLSTWARPEPSGSGPSTLLLVAAKSASCLETQSLGSGWQSLFFSIISARQGCNPYQWSPSRNPFHLVRGRDIWFSYQWTSFLTRGLLRHVLKSVALPELNK